MMLLTAGEPRKTRAATVIECEVTVPDERNAADVGFLRLLADPISTGTFVL